MVTLLAGFFIKEKVNKAKIRQSYGVLCGVVGIFLNVLLFAGKFLAGMLSNSIAITADAVNNLSDAGSSVVTLLGFKLARGEAGFGASVWSWQDGVHFRSGGGCGDSFDGIRADP